PPAAAARAPPPPPRPESAAPRAAAQNSAAKPLLLDFSGRCSALLCPPSFPTRRSSDLLLAVESPTRPHCRRYHHDPAGHRGQSGDRKSTRLNSSHRKISYAVFCLKKKKKENKTKIRSQIRILHAA